VKFARVELTVILPFVDGEKPSLKIAPEGNGGSRELDTNTGWDPITFNIAYQVCRGIVKTGWYQ
jgi:hypothetical protein